MAPAAIERAPIKSSGGIDCSPSATARKVDPQIR
jgi:hypothetical protein